MAFRTRLQSREQVAENTWTFHLEKPEGFTYRGGQTVDLTLLDAPEVDEKGTTRTYSLASAPYEKTLSITTRMRESAFKRVLGGLPMGAEVSMDGPFGSFTLHNNTAKSAVFLAGGIGITPFRSMILQATRENLEHRIVLFYSNRRPEDAAFLDELEVAKKQNPRFAMVATMTQAGLPSNEWAGERGHVNDAMLRRYISDTTNPIYYIAGPPPMVAAMYQMLVRGGVDSDTIRTDEFAGY